MTAPLTRIGPYRLLDVLGQGGMGVVYRARHEVSGDIVALKTIRAASEIELESIRREIRALARIDHPGIVRVVSEGLADGLPWYAMDYLSGSTMRQYFNHYLIQSSRRAGSSSGDEPGDFTQRVGGPVQPDDSDDISFVTTDLSASDGQLVPVSEESSSLPSSRVQYDHSLLLRFIYRLCSPLAFLHGEGIVHRDLKPDNIMIRDDGTPVLVDLGLMAYHTDEGSRETLNIDFMRAGTVSYMAPEQITGDLVDARTDLYALGCILYEFLVGHTPFVGVNQRQILFAHLYKTPNPPSRFRPDIQPELDDLICRLLAKIPHERVGHADAVASKLAPFIDEAGSLASPKAKVYLYRSHCTGRKAVLEKLTAHGQELKKGKGGLILIGGESGIGKTRLINELGRQLTRAEILVLSGEGSETAGVSLQALVKPLQTIADRCRERGLEETEKIVGKRGKVFAMYEATMSNLPGQEKYPEPATLSLEAARLRLFNYLSETFRDLAATSPVGLFLDDLQWADELVLGYLEFELRRNDFEESAFLIIGTYRSEDKEILLPIINLPQTITFNLTRLDEMSVADIVGDMLGMIPPPNLFSAYVFRRSEGNPLFVSEFLRIAIETGLLNRDDQGSWQLDVAAENGASEMQIYEQLPLPTSLHTIFEQRLEKLSEHARATLRIAAVVGQNINLELLLTLTGLVEKDFVYVCDELLDKQMLEMISAQEIRFTHSHVRSLAEKLVTVDESREIHRRAAQNMERLFDHERDRYLPALGVHWEGAGEKDQARTCYLAAARLARDRYDQKEAERLYQACLNVLTETALDEVDIRRELGKVLIFSGRLEAAKQELITVCHKTDDHEILTDSRNQLAKILSKQGDIDEARKMFHKALQCADSFPCLKTIILNDLAFMENDARNNHLEAERLCERALNTIVAAFPVLKNYYDPSSRVEKEERPPAEALNSLAATYTTFGIIHRFRANYDLALDYQSRCLAIYQDTDAPHQIAVTYSNMALIKRQLGDYEQALEWYKKSIAIAEEIGDRVSVGRTAGNLGVVHILRGEYDLALACFQQAIDVMQAANVPLSLGKAWGNIGHIHLFRGDPRQALQYYQKDLEISQENGDRQGIGRASGNIGCVYYNLGDYIQAIEYHQKELTICREIGDRRAVGRATCSIGNAYLELGELDKALSLMQESFLLFEEIGDRRNLAHAAASIGTAHTRQVNLTQAFTFLQKGLAISEEIGDQEIIWKTWYHMGNASQIQGDMRQALEYFRKSRAVCLKIGCTIGEQSNLRQMGTVFRARNEIDRALEYHQQALVLSDALNLNKAESVLSLSETYRVSGDVEKALKLNALSRDLSNKSENELEVADSWYYRVECELDRGDLSAASDALAKAQEIYDRTKGVSCAPRLPLLKQRLLLAEIQRTHTPADTEKINHAVEAARNLVRWAEQSDREGVYVESLFLLGQTLTHASKTEEAVSCLHQALEKTQQNGLGLLEQRIHNELLKQPEK
ncbi:tetratricopeptide repeat protein [candidate division CSSED10-310 bacterium]|uniref:Tetratricopeptide repeat protein n=1 Tax=candidate division CSSED10-310 bacterium TaxID=2855610 RepID=A0ABV6YYH4_UNCC1